MKEKKTEKTMTATNPQSVPDNALVEEHLNRMPSLFSRGLLYLVLLIIGVSVVYSLVCEVDIVSECRAVARPKAHKLNVMSDQNAYVEKVFIKEGQRVKKDAPLFLVRSKEAVSYTSKVEELTQSIPRKERYFDTLIETAEARRAYLDIERNNRLKAKEIELEQNRIALTSIESDMAYWEKQVRSLTDEFENTRRLFEKQLTSMAEFNSIKSRLERAQTEAEKLASEKKIKIKAINLIEREINVVTTDYENDRNLLEQEIKNLKLEKETTLFSMKKELDTVQQMLHIKDCPTGSSACDELVGNIIKAPAAGGISEVYFLNPGEYLVESALMCTIIPENSPIYMDISVANKDIGFIEKNMAIKYKFDAFPYIDYGILTGIVEYIAPSAIEGKTGDFVYRIRGTLDRDFYEIRDNRYPVKAGMTATAELVTERKSLFALLFRKLRG